VKQAADIPCRNRAAGKTDYVSVRTSSALRKSRHII
jgi:hypothetical protein